MLYQMYETQRSLVEPFADFALAASKLYSNPLSPFSQTPLSQRISAGFELFYRLGKDYEKPQFGITTVDVEGVGVTIMERVEIDKPFCELRRFKRFTDEAATLQTMLAQPAVLVVAPLSGHYATLLRDTVRSMLSDHKVYITDWKDARMVPLDQGEFHLDDYINYVQDFIRHLQGQYGNCHVVSVCQPTVPVLAAVSLMASRGETTPLTLTMMGGPIDARLSPTAVNNLATTRSRDWFENNVIHQVPSNYPGAGRRVYPGFLQHTGFVAMNPDRHATSHYDYFKNLLKGDDAGTEAHRKFYDEYNAVLDMDAPYYLETIHTVFQDFSLVKGTWDVKSPEGKPERVRPQDIEHSALLTIEGELDDISGAGQTRAAHGLCTGIAPENRHHIEVEGAGHYGIFSGRRWREKVYPQVRDFILAHNVQAPSPVDDGIGHDAPSKGATVKAASAVLDLDTIIELPGETIVDLAQVTPPDTAKTVLEAALEMGLAPETVDQGPAARAPEAPKRKARGPRRS
ncbi:polyhydroxyalkanoate depolymerase [Comamonas endophytica]|uniref:Polyhydroxyalkanoate depolymerase n=1 Tax=Comamonas endophytica TaxID=2949090 RepID=A0ABY6GAW8_9BURK|nr:MULTISPECIES: polyhydroxyalkanoate depolymerase [unclassified Acidovorax]MCD2511916.1 polyhydroxyalkanoate depolymerase [Acidovorax sp. D4N7]UYG51634.1 polyhydroxyalkanoate depolymerase [Acidovorax sp. 5MLIR]